MQNRYNNISKKHLFPSIELSYICSTFQQLTSAMLCFLILKNRRVSMSLIRNFFNPENNTKIWLGGFLGVSDSLFSKDMRNSKESLKQGVVCRTAEEAEQLCNYLKLCAKVWQFSTHGIFANPEILNLTENLLNLYINDYEQPVQGELFSVHPNVLDFQNHRDTINYDEYGEAYLKKSLSGLSEKGKKIWSRKLGYKL